MILSNEQIRRLYGRTAHFYDFALLGYRLLGVTRQRRKAIDALQLRPGDTVVDLGCGTGANFALLVEAVGSTGRIVGVDLSAAMLAQAKRRIDKAGWNNIDLVETDLVHWKLPTNTAGVLATFALEMVPEYETVVRHLASELDPGKRLSLLGMKYPKRWPEWLIRLGLWLNKPFGVSREYASFHPWESVEHHLTVVLYEDLYYGAAYRCVGERQKAEFPPPFLPLGEVSTAF